MKVLVTGGAGYVGSILVPILLENDNKVRVLDNLMYNNPSLISCFINPNFQFIKGDIRNFDDVKLAIQDVDTIIHLAAIVGAPACKKEPKIAWDVNLQGTINLDKSRSKHIKIVYASTGSVYGALKDICTENSPINPLTIYGKSKYAAEKFIIKAGNSVALRFATAFGLSPRIRLDLLPNYFTWEAIKNHYLLIYEKDFRRTFIHVRDMARAFIHALDFFSEMQGEVYNVGGEEMNMTKEELAIKILNKVDYRIEFADTESDPDKRDYNVSYEKIRKMGFNLSIDMDKGIEELIQGYKMLNSSTDYSNYQ